MLVTACSFCANTQLHQRWWQLGAVGAASFVLLIELAVASGSLKALSSLRRVVVHALLALALVGGVLAALTAPVLGGLVFLSVLAVRALAVAAFTLRSDPVAVSARLGAAVVALGASVLLNLPANRSRDELVTLLTATPFHFDKRSWAFTRLETDEGLGEVEARLEHLRADDPKALVTLELHQQLGGAPARRIPLCLALAARPPDERLAPRLDLVCNVTKAPGAAF
ncbi:MAG: hypothetical protein ABTQ32_27595 [Myxococcaceae bacterium]